MARYHIDAQSTDLSAVQQRLQSTDLIPSQAPLLDGIAEKISSIGDAGVRSLADLRTALKTETSLTLLSKTSGVDSSYLKLLRRAINGFFPKPRSLEEIDWLDANAVASFNKAGIENTQTLFDAASDDATGLAETTGIDRKTVLDFMAIADLCRIQWVSPTFARALAAAGFTTAAVVAQADPDALFQAVAKANQTATFYKGKIGLRDIRRLVDAASYVP